MTTSPADGPDDGADPPRSDPSQPDWSQPDPSRPAGPSAESTDSTRTRIRRARTRRRWSLRARLIALVLAVAAVAVAAVDVVIPLNVHATLMSGKKQTLASVVDNLKSMPPGSLGDQLGAAGSGASLGGQVGWTLGYSNGTSQVVQPVPSMPAANPRVGWNTPTARPEVVGDVDDAGPSYLAWGYRTHVWVPDRGDVLAVNVIGWIPLADVSSTVRRLIVLEIAISLGLLLMLGAVAGVVVRRELRPLETMSRAADDISTGDLSRRVDPGPVGTEVGRLGTAFNGMVDGVSALLAERAASEQRMRQFVADASHELRTPVAAIRGYTDLYGAGALDEEEALTRAMGRMGFETQRMGALVEDLLTLTKADAQTATPPTDRVELVPLLAGVVDDAAVIDRSRTWRLAGTAARAVVAGDEMRLHQLFANLLANVRTHTPPGTTATVSVDATDELVAVSVIDDGPGVAEENLPRLFDRFFRADAARSRESGGSGLGLSIAAAITRMHRGHITAGTSSGGGLTITVVLPTDSPGDVPAPEHTAG